MSKKKKTRSTTASRAKIDVLALITALENHVINGAEMSSTQVNAALALLKKILPDSRTEAEKEADVLSHEEALDALE